MTTDCVSRSHVARALVNAAASAVVLLVGLMVLAACASTPTDEGGNRAAASGSAAGNGPRAASTTQSRGAPPLPVLRATVATATAVPAPAHPTAPPSST